MTPRVSIVVPAYKADRFIERAIASVRAQTFQRWEMVVVDDGSPGDLRSVIREELAAEPRLRLLRQANRGSNNARNTGARACVPITEYLVFLDADDCLEPETLAVLVAYLDAHSEAGMVFCDRILIDARDQPLEEYADDWIRRYVPNGLGVRRLLPTEADTPFVSLYAYSIAVPSATLMRRSVYEAVGGWDESLGPIYDDTDLYLRVALRSHVHYLPHRLLRRRLHGQQNTRSPRAEARLKLATQKFQRKWSTGDWLGPDDRRLVRRARRFRDGQLLPYLWFSWAGERARHKEPAEAVKYWLRGCKHLVLHGPAAILEAAS